MTLLSVCCGDCEYGKGAKKEARRSCAEWKEPADRTSEGLRRAAAAASVVGLKGEFEIEVPRWWLLPKLVPALDEMLMFGVGTMVGIVLVSVCSLSLALCLVNVRLGARMRQMEEVSRDE